jgi:hypothetical protein
MKKLLFILSLIPLVTLGPVMCGTGENVTKSGTAWTNAGNLTADDNAYATCTGTLSQYLYAHNFDFSSLPSGATITNVAIIFEVSATTNGSLYSISAQLINESGTAFGNQVASGVNGTTTLNSIIMGVTPTAGQLKDPDFGVRLDYSSSSTETVNVDYVSLTVTYKIGGGFFQLMSSSQ